MNGFAQGSTNNSASTQNSSMNGQIN